MRRCHFPRSRPRIDLVEATVAEMKGDFNREQKSAAAGAVKANARGARFLFANARLRECWALKALAKGKEERKKALEHAEVARQTFAAVGDREGEARALKNFADVMDDIPDHRAGQDVLRGGIENFSPNWV